MRSVSATLDKPSHKSGSHKDRGQKFRWKF